MRVYLSFVDVGTSVVPVPADETVEMPAVPRVGDEVSLADCSVYRVDSVSWCPWFDDVDVMLRLVGP